MIEAVNSALASGTAVKTQESVPSARSYAASPGKIQDVAIAPYISPKVRMDVDFDKAILEFRSAETGDIIAQTPSKQQLQAYRKSTTDTTIDVRDVEVARTTPAPAPEPEVAVEVKTPVDSTDK
jgi:hypothetical protein